MNPATQPVMAVAEQVATFSPAQRQTLSEQRRRQRLGLRKGKERTHDVELLGGSTISCLERDLASSGVQREPELAADDRVLGALEGVRLRAELAGVRYERIESARAGKLRERSAYRAGRSQRNTSWG